MKIDLSNKNILVTGAAGTGVGSGICEAVAACGGRLIINDIDQDKIDEAVKKYPNAIGIEGDISDAGDVRKIFEKAKNECGIIHGLVNNAGVGLRKKAHLADLSDFDRVFDIDIRGVWLMSRAFVAQLMDHQTTGHIVNISSVHAQASTQDYAIYASAKSAVEGLTRGMSIDLGEKGIRCNAVAPGYVDSEHNQEAIASWTDDREAWLEKQFFDYQSLHHPVLARDCGNAVVFLLSDLSRSITGQTLTVDAGITNLIYANSFLPSNSD